MVPDSPTYLDLTAGTAEHQTVSMRFHHVGIVTNDLDKAIALYTDLGYKPSAKSRDDIQKATVVFLSRYQDPVIELIAPTEPTSPAAKWAQRLGAGAYHTCYAVGDLEAAIAWFRARRFCIASAPAPATAFEMRKVVFLWSSSAGLVELVEDASPMSPRAEDLNTEH